MKQLEIEYTNTQNDAQKVLDGKLTKLSKKQAYHPDVYDTGSHNVRIPEQNQLYSAVSNQLIMVMRRAASLYEQFSQ